MAKALESKLDIRSTSDECYKTVESILYWHWPVDGKHFPDLIQCSGRYNLIFGETCMALTVHNSQIKMLNRSKIPTDSNSGPK